MAQNIVALHLLPLNDHIWKQYVMFLRARDARIPTMQPDGIWVGLQDATLVAGCLIYPTPGEYLFAENMTVNPTLPARLRHQAVDLVIQALLHHCATRGKYPMLLIRHSSIARMLQRRGFSFQPTSVMSAYPAPVVATYQEKRRQATRGESTLPAHAEVNRLTEDVPVSAPKVKSRKRNR